MIEQYHELRYIETSSKDSATFSLFDDIEDRLTLMDLIKEKDYIFLLGNPGVGKTTELKTVFKELWKEKQTNQLVPLFINIKNFRYTSTIEDLITFDEWQKIPAVLFIFDGLDEIGNIRDFISELQNFISKYAELKLKFVISCRTNIYQKYLIDLSNFTTVYLKNLSHYQISNILNKKYDVQISAKTVNDFYSILQIPFNLNLFAQYYIINKNFPETIEKSLELLLNEGIARTMEMLKKRFDTNKAQINIALEKVALINELMLQNAISEDHLYRLVGNDTIKVFTELPFITKNDSSDSYSFIHKNYQEYYAAKYISLMNPAEIIKFIKADDLEKIRPNLFNTTTFLLNILKEDKFEKLKNWLLENDIEILFFADGNRLSPDLQNEIFKKYFTEICIEKTYWISSNGKISIDILAKFAAFEFLIKQLVNKEAQNRVRGSALEVIAQKPLTEPQSIILKENFQDLLKEQNDSLSTEVLRASKVLNFHKDPNFLNEVLTIIKDLDSRDIYHQIISILSDVDNDKSHSDLFLNTVKRYYSTNDNVIRGTEFLIASTILNTEDEDLNLALIDLLFDEDYSLRSNTIFYDNFEDKLLEKIKIFSADPNYVRRLLEIAFSGEHRIMSNPLLRKLLSIVDMTPELVLHILQKEKMSRNMLYNISSLLNKKSIDAIAANYKEGTLEFNPIDNIDSLRNWLSNTNLELGLYLEQKFKEVGYNFSALLKTDEQIKTRQIEYDDFQKYNSNLLFDKEDLLEEIKTYFAKHRVESLSKEEFQKLFFNWFDEYNFHGIQYTVHTVLETAFRHKLRVNLDDISKLFEDPYFYLSIIKTALNHNSFKTFTLENNQLLLIKSLADSIADKINFEDVIRINPHDPNRFSTTINFSYLKLVLFFETNYEILRSKEFYLNALEFGNLGDPANSDGSSFIDHIMKRIHDRIAINERIVKNINKGHLTVFAKEDHIAYAIEQDLEDSFDKIGEEILSDNTLFNQNNILDKYIKKIPEPLDFLKRCCTDSKSYFYWYVINLIKENKMDDEFILYAAMNYLESDDMKFIDDAVNVLFFLNWKNAMEHYYKALVRIVDAQQDSSGILPKDVMNYKNLKELHFLPCLFKIAYSLSPFGSFYLYQSRKFMNFVISNLSETDQGYQQVREILSTIKEDLSKLTDKEEFSHKIYYLNELIDFSYNSYLKSKSERLTFDQAITFLKK